MRKGVFLLLLLVALLVIAPVVAFGYTPNNDFDIVEAAQETKIMFGEEVAGLLRGEIVTASAVDLSKPNGLLGMLAFEVRAGLVAAQYPVFRGDVGASPLAQSGGIRLTAGFF